jgi:hypothetical protein
MFWGGGLIVDSGGGVPLNELGAPLNKLGVPPCWRAYFLLLRQKKVAKEKATPRSAPLRGSLRYSAHRAACLNSPAAQTRQADGPRSACVAQRLSRGPEGRPCSTDERLKVHSCGQPGKNPKSKGSTASHPPTHTQSPSFPRRREFTHCQDSHLKNYGATVSTRVVSPGPLRGAEQRRGAGGLRLALSEPQASLAGRPDHRVAQGTGAAGTDPGVAFSLATFFWRSKRKYARASSAENTAKRSNQKPIPTPTLPLPQGILDIKGREPHLPLAPRDAVPAEHQGQDAKPINHPTSTPPITTKTTRDNP